MDMNTLKQLWFESRKGQGNIIVGVVALVVLVIGAIIVQSVVAGSTLNGTTLTVAKFFPTVMILSGLALAGFLAYKEYK